MPTRGLPSCTASRMRRSSSAPTTPTTTTRTTAISGAYEYRITGRRNTVTYLGFGTQAGHYGQGGGLPPTGYLEAGELETGTDGRFELVLSTEPKAGNWLPMTPETGTLIVRQTFLDRATEVPAELHIERIAPPGDEGGQNPLTPSQIDAGLKSVSRLVAGASLLFAKWARDFQKHGNALPRFDQETSNAAAGDPNIAYYHSHWALGPDEALVIEAMPPPCEYWNFQLNNYWMESLDYRHHRIHTNKHPARYEPDGSVRLVVAHEDPGLPNWIETAGHEPPPATRRRARPTARPAAPRQVGGARHRLPRARLLRRASRRARRAR